MAGETFAAEWHGYVPEMVEWGRTGDYREIRCEDAPARNANAAVSRAMTDIAQWASVSSAGFPFDRRDHRGGCVLEVRVQPETARRAGGREAIRGRLAAVAGRLLAELAGDGWAADMPAEVTAFTVRPSEGGEGSNFEIKVCVHRAPAEAEVIACGR